VLCKKNVRRFTREIWSGLTRRIHRFHISIPPEQNLFQINTVLSEKSLQ
jgi:hypothetical protein